MAEKRKVRGEPGEAATSKRQKPRLLLNVNKASAETRAITKHNDETPFFKLPKEIRDQIYKLVLSDRIIHNYRNNRSRNNQWDDNWTLTVCRCRQTNQEIYEEFIAPRAAHYTEPGKWTDHHIHCKKMRILTDNFAPDEQLLPAESVTAQFLRTCRRIYYEASYLLLSSNTLSLGDLHMLNEWVGSLMPAQQRQIKSINLHLGADDANNGLPTLLLPNVQALTGLRYLHVTSEMDWPTGAEFYEARQKFLQGGSSFLISSTRNVYDLRRCSLAKVTMTVIDREPSPLRLNRYQWRWSVAEKHKLAKHFEAQLLTEWNEEEHQEQQAMERAKKLEGRKKSLTHMKTTLQALQTSRKTIRNEAKCKTLEKRIHKEEAANMKSEEYNAKRRVLLQKKKSEILTGRGIV
ncbi:hypothetical protein EJ08DRAFT_683446 [Tothia fuscella]|uniref:DUF7730 domain-containing protein n=1 Tax=Tothia fuscella TaxID=1048955 RepID=A0A9P4NG16_9PEZI|nr:hypothetical protein EJ08DRAFT_683446 [Tothia fuscella]